MVVVERLLELQEQKRLPEFEVVKKAISQCFCGIENNQASVEVWYSVKSNEIELIFLNNDGSKDIHPRKTSVQQIKYKSEGTIYSDTQAINYDLDITLNLNYINIKNNRKSALDTLKKKLIKVKNTGDWSNLAKKYYTQLNQAQIKSPYVGILLNYLKRYII